MEKSFFKKNLRLSFSARKNVLKNFKSRFFQIKNLYKIPKHEPTPELPKKKTIHKKSVSKLQQELMNEIIADESDINDKIFLN